jgi:hypothetical protein
MQHIKPFLVIVIAAALAACEKHRREENTDTSAYHHPTNEKGAPVRNPPPETVPTPPIKDSQDRTYPPNR